MAYLNGSKMIIFQVMSISINLLYQKISSATFLTYSREF